MVLDERRWLRLGPGGRCMLRPHDTPAAAAIVLEPAALSAVQPPLRKALGSASGADMPEVGNPSGEPADRDPRDANQP